MRTQLCNTRGPETPQLLRMLGKALQKQASSWRPHHFNSTATSSQSLVNGRQRDDIVQWLAQLNKKFKFYPETFALSSTLLDSFLQLVKAHPKYLKCIGIACFYLAAKVLEENELVPGVCELVKRSGCGCTRAELLRMERVILDKLGWDLSLPTSLDFLHIFHALVLVREPGLLAGVEVTPARQLSLLTHKLLRCTSHHRLLAMSPSCRALAILSLELELFRPDWLPITLALQALAQVSSENLIRCREGMTQVLLYSGQTSCLQLPHKLYAAIGTKPTKRKVVEDDENGDDDDLIDDIKRLYNEEGSELLTSTSKSSSTCGSQVRQDCSSMPPLQTVAN